MKAEMTINGIDIAAYNARLLDFSVSGTTLTNNLSSASVALRMPTLYSIILAPRILTISLTFFPIQLGSDSRNTNIPEKLTRAAENITRFESEIIGKTVEITLPDGYIYTALVNAIPAAVYDSSGEHDVTYTFSAIRHLSSKQATVKSGQQIFCSSNTRTPCKIMFTAPYPLASVTVCGVKILSIKANTEIIIDSENGLITADGHNKFIDTEFSDFPALNPGENIITCSDLNIDIKVVYTPIFA